MTRRIATVLITIVSAVALAVVTVLGAPSASAHTHPAPPELTAPGVVYIESGYHVQITLIEHNPSMMINLVKRSYDPVLERGSGFVVDPSAAIVTTAAVSSPDLRAAKNFAINSAFKDTYGTSDPNLVLPRNPFAQTSFDPSVGQPLDYTNLARLKACYTDTTNSAGGCVITSSRFVTVHPYVTDQAKYGDLNAKVLSTTASGISVLQVSAGSMPAVDLANETPSTYHLWVFGFTGVPVVNGTLQTFKAHLNEHGGNAFRAPVGDNAPFAAVTPAVLASGLQGGPIAVELGQVIGMISATPAPPGSPAPGGPTFIGMPAIRAALAQAGVTPAHGPADAAFETAMHEFQNKGYAASISGFRTALSAYPGDYPAATHLKAALKLAKSVPPASTAPVSSSPAAAHPAQGVPWWVWLIVGVAAVLGAALIWWLVRRRRDRPGRSPAPAATPTPRTGPGAEPAQRAPAARPPGARTPEGPAARSSGGPASPLHSPGRQARPVAAGIREPAVMTQSAAPAARTAAPKATRFCTSCGGRLAPHHAFCGWCGEPVG